jgi:hypothetical protein
VELKAVFDSFLPRMQNSPWVFISLRREAEAEA